MENSLPQCNQCSSPVTDSIEIEIENDGRVKLGNISMVHGHAMIV